MGVLYNSRIVTDGLILCVDAGDKMSYPGAGTAWTDLSKQGNNGTLTNGPTFDSANRGSILFDGSNDFVDLGDFDLTQVSTGITVSLWFKGPNTQTGQWPLLIGNGGGWNAGGFLLMKYGSGFRWEIQGSGGGNGGATGGRRSLDYTSGFWDDTWQNVVGSWSGNLMKIYRVGLMINSGDGVDDISATGGTGYLRLGGKGSSNAPSISTANAQVMIGSVQIYGRQLTDAEVLKNYNSMKARFGL